jgi:NADPH:quinone reductase-like Zn-dependent oxidoreductase
MLGHVTDPAAPDGLDRRELPEPEPGPHDVVVEVRAYAVNRGELSLLQQRADGWLPGQDVAGVVARAAADGSGPPEGTRVVGIADGGGWSQRVLVPAHRVAPLPDATSFEDAAALPVAGLTALRALREAGPLLGRRLLVTGATGGVGSFAVQLGAAAGAHVTALVSRSERADAARALGAHAVVTLEDDAFAPVAGGESAAGDSPGAAGGGSAAVDSPGAAGGGPFHAVLDGVGGPVLAAAIHALAERGAVIAYGVAGGRPQTPLAFFDFGVSGRLGRLVGFFVYATGEETFGEDLGALAALVADGRLRVDRELTRDWGETRAAVQALRDRSVTGKVVLTV